MDSDRVDDIGLAGNQLGTKSLGKLKGRLLLLRREAFGRRLCGFRVRGRVERVSHRKCGEQHACHQGAAKKWTGMHNMTLETLAWRAGVREPPEKARKHSACCRLLRGSRTPARHKICFSAKQALFTRC